MVVLIIIIKFAEAEAGRLRQAEAGWAELS